MIGIVHPIVARGLLAVGSILFVALSLPLRAAERPNIIWIMADDLGYGELGCYGQKVIQTPHIDRMAQEGLLFTHFYAGATVCAPSRSVLMTGQHHGRTRVRGNAGKTNPIAQSLRPDDITVAKVLQQAGYRTASLANGGSAISAMPMPGYLAAKASTISSATSTKSMRTTTIPNSSGAMKNVSHSQTNAFESVTKVEGMRPKWLLSPMNESSRKGWSL